jgi:hypothetical protein
VAVLELAEQQHSSGLRHGLNDQYPGHDGKIGEVTSKKVLVDGYVFDGHDALLAGQFHDSVNQQERIAVWQDLENFLNVELDGRYGRGCGWLGVVAAAGGGAADSSVAPGAELARGLAVFVARQSRWSLILV